MASPLSGMYDVLNCFELLGTFDEAVPPSAPFHVEFVSSKRGRAETASGLPVEVHRSLADITSTDIVIIPSLLAENGEWVPGRHADVVKWLAEMNDRGAMLCSACSGVLLLAETGLLDGEEATIHWAYAPTFRKNFPAVQLCLDKVLVASGERAQFVMAGASASWHDLVLYLVARWVGPTAAQAISKFLLLQWHKDGQAPYISFRPDLDHADAVVRVAQEWLAGHFSIANPVEEAVKRSGLAERSFKRRFTQATGYSPIAYVQQLRVHEAKRRLERTEEAVDEISWKVGYEEAAFFRRLFKRLTGISPGAYRRKFKVPLVVTNTMRAEHRERLSPS
jgi:transcriptional regulator GlxA family with amidase domain